MTGRLIDAFIFVTDRLRTLVLTLAVLGLWQLGWSLAAPSAPEAPRAVARIP